MIKICTRIIRYAIAVPRVDLTQKSIRKQKLIDFFPIVGRLQQKLGACVFNQPANQNIITAQFADQLARFLLSYHYDNSVDNIFIESKEGVFSHGVDYKRLTEDPHYLDQLSKLAVIFAKLNKPTLGQISGGVKGAGAYLLSMMTMPMGYKDAYLRIDEVGRGMVPVMGGSHRLARLPLHLGYYLALTSEQLNSQQMAQLGFLKGGIRDGISNNQIRKKLCEANLFFREKFRYCDFEQAGALEHAQRRKINKTKSVFRKKLKRRQAELLSQPSRNVNLKFAVNQHTLASSDFYNATNPFNSFSENKGRNINNYFLMRQERPLNYLKEHNLVEVYDITGIKIKRFDVAKIDHIFGKDTIEEIISELEKENSEWAERALRRIKAADPLALHLTFQLLKKAEKQSWIACLETEYAVAKRLTEVSTLQMKVLSNSSQYTLQNQYTGKGVNSVPKEVIDSYFASIEGDYKFEHEVPSYSLHPNSDYYRDLPDSVRTYLNRQNFSDKHLTEQDFEIHRFLNNWKINYRSQTYDVNLLRQNVYKKLQLQKESELIAQRLSHLAENSPHLEKYRHQRKAYLENITAAQLQTLITEEVQEIFKSKFEERFAQFEGKTAQMMGLESKVDLFKRIKDIIIKNVVYKGSEYENKQKLETPYNGPIYFDDQGRDIFSSRNKYIDANQPLRQLADDLSIGTAPSQDFLQHADQELPKFFGTPDELAAHEKAERDSWAAIKDRYDDKPEIIAEALIYKQLVLQASRTSEELAGYLGWTAQNYYDLIENSQKHRETYGELASEIVTEVSNIRQDKLTKLAQVEQERNLVMKKGLFTPFYQFKQEERMREVFPYYVSQSLIPGQFRRSFLSVLDSTLKQFTNLEKGDRKKLLVRQELGLLDKWINKDIVTNYTAFLKYDIEYISSYLYILFVKEMLTDIKVQKTERPEIDKLTDYIRQKYHIDFNFNSNTVTHEEIDTKIISFLYFLMDMHSNAKKHIQSPQSKLIDFINRLQVAYENRQDIAMPYSFEGLMLLIAKDRRKIYDRFLNEKNIAQPEFLLSYLNREGKKNHLDIFKKENRAQIYKDNALKLYFDQQTDGEIKSKRLVQNYFYYMLEFEKYIHKICGKEAFLPANFVNPQFQQYNDYCKQILAPLTHQQWLRHELRNVIQQLLSEREEMERKLTKGELIHFDKQFERKLLPNSVRRLIRNKLEQEVSLVKNVFKDNRQYEFEPTEEQTYDEKYTRVKRLTKNPDALKKFNNLNLSEQVYLEYMQSVKHKDDMSVQQLRFMLEEKRFFKKKGKVTRLPARSYRRMARDVFKHPEDNLIIQDSPQDTQLFKKTNIQFSRALAGDKIQLSEFSEEYKLLQKRMKDNILQQIVSKIQKVESL